MLYEQSPAESSQSNVKLDLIIQYCSSNERMSYLNTPGLNPDLIKNNQEIYRFFLRFSEKNQNQRNIMIAKTVLNILNQQLKASDDESGQLNDEEEIDYIAQLCKLTLRSRLVRARDKKVGNAGDLTCLAEEIEASRDFLVFIEQFYSKNIDEKTIFVALTRLIHALTILEKSKIEQKAGLFLQKGVLYGLRAALIHINNEQPSQIIADKVQILCQKAKNLVFVPVLDPACTISILEGFLSIDNDSLKNQRDRVFHCWDFSRVAYIESIKWSPQDRSLFNPLHRRINLKQLESGIEEKIEHSLKLPDFIQFISELEFYIDHAGMQNYSESLVKKVKDYCKTTYGQLTVDEKQRFRKEIRPVLKLLRTKQSTNSFVLRNEFLELFMTLFTVVPSVPKPKAARSTVLKQAEIKPKITPPSTRKKVSPPAKKPVPVAEPLVTLFKRARPGAKDGLPFIQLGTHRSAGFFSVQEPEAPEPVIALTPPLETDPMMYPEQFNLELSAKAANLNTAYHLYREARHRLVLFHQSLANRQFVLSQPMTLMEQRIQLGHSLYNRFSEQQNALRMLSLNVYDLYLIFESHYLGVNHWLSETIDEQLVPIEHWNYGLLNQDYYQEVYRRRMLLTPEEQHFVHAMELEIDYLRMQPELIIDLLRIKLNYGLILADPVLAFLYNEGPQYLKSAMQNHQQEVMDKVWLGFKLPNMLAFYNELHHFNLFPVIFPALFDLLEHYPAPEQLLQNIASHLEVVSFIEPEKRNREKLFRHVFKVEESQSEPRLRP